MHTLMQKINDHSAHVSIIGLGYVGLPLALGFVMAGYRVTGIDTEGICLRRDSGVSVMYAEALNSTTSSVTLQRTDRHGILGQKSAHCQMSL
jgi:UDP-N-acetyl-D-mannosaminuronate dehydrogenase